MHGSIPSFQKYTYDCPPIVWTHRPIHERTHENRGDTTLNATRPGVGPARFALPPLATMSLMRNATREALAQ